MACLQIDDLCQRCFTAAQQRPNQLLLDVRGRRLVVRIMRRALAPHLSVDQVRA